MRAVPAPVSQSVMQLDAHDTIKHSEVNTLPPSMLPTWSEFGHRELSLVVGSACTLRQLTALLVVNHPVWHLLLHDGQKLYPYMRRAALHNYGNPP